MFTITLFRNRHQEGPPYMPVRSLPHSRPGRCNHEVHAEHRHRRSPVKALILWRKTSQTHRGQQMFFDDLKHLHGQSAIQQTKRLTESENLSYSSIQMDRHDSSFLYEDNLLSK